jgi:hypothetical protein
MKKWIKKNVIGELPIIGVFFRGLDCSKACHHALKMSCEITGAIIGMIVYMENASMPSNNDDMPSDHQKTTGSYYAQMGASMVLGEMIGAVTFNTAYSLIKMTKNNYSFWRGRSEEKTIIAVSHRSDDQELNVRTIQQ